MERVYFTISLFLGIFFAYISVPVLGYGAAIAIPIDFFTFLVKTFLLSHLLL